MIVCTHTLCYRVQLICICHSLIPLNNSITDNYNKYTNWIISFPNLTEYGGSIRLLDALQVMPSGRGYVAHDLVNLVDC